jgi:1-acyl-sn-glycerol-3-phosphate acyltransferase
VVLPDWLSYLWYEMWYGLTFAGMTLGFSLRIEGASNVPRDGPVLLIANHQSYLDPLVVGLASRRHVHFLARKGLFRNRLFGAYLRSANCVPVDQEGVAKEGIKTALKLLQDGRVVVIFPEGERTHTGQMQPLRPGLHLLIKRAGATVVPVGVAGAYQAYPRTQLLPRLSPLFLPANGCGVAACVGRPLPAKLYAHVPREQALADLFGRLEAVQQRAERLRRQS